MAPAHQTSLKFIHVKRLCHTITTLSALKLQESTINNWRLVCTFKSTKPFQQVNAVFLIITSAGKTVFVQFLSWSEGAVWWPTATQHFLDWEPAGEIIGKIETDYDKKV